MKRLTSLVALGAALAALCAPAVTLAAGGTPTLSQNSDSGFPDKSFTLTLPQKRALSASQVTVTENGTPAVASAGAMILR